MAKEVTFKTIFPAVAVLMNDDYTINEPEFRSYLRWIKSFYDKGMKGLESSPNLCVNCLQV